jgi:transposase-like protein
VSDFVRQGKQIELDSVTAKQSMANPNEMIKISSKFTILIELKNYSKVQQKYETIDCYNNSIYKTVLLGE